MEKTKSKVRRITYTIITIILVILNIYTLYLYSYKLSKYNNLQKNNTTIENKLSNIIKEKDIEDNKLKNIEEDIDKINNIDKQIEEIKNKFYENESKYEKLVLEGKGSKKIAYLTFDDGPYQISYQFLDVLDKYDILATFFVIGNKPDDRLPIYKEEVRRGHTIANHTYYHSISKGLYNSVSSFTNQIKKNEDFILKETGIKTNILRFPGGSNQAKGLKTSIIKEISNMGYGYVDWDLETGDGKKIAPTIKESIDNVLNKTNDRDIVVVLMHDYSSVTLSALPSIIEGLEKQNYIMLPLFYESVKVKKS